MLVTLATPSFHLLVVEEFLDLVQHRLRQGAKKRNGAHHKISYLMMIMEAWKSAQINEINEKYVALIAHRLELGAHVRGNIGPART